MSLWKLAGAAALAVATIAPAAADAQRYRDGHSGYYGRGYGHRGYRVPRGHYRPYRYRHRGYRAYYGPRYGYGNRAFYGPRYGHRAYRYRHY